MSLKDSDRFRALKSSDPLFAVMRGELDAAGLPVDDLFEGAAQYYALDGFAFGGLMTFGDIALLRSLVVAPVKRGIGAGVAMLDQLLEFARRQGLHEVWLLTTGAEPFFSRHGFVRASRDAAPDEIRATRQFSSLCPDSAALMKCVL
jgi:amino-acid N-acetyltransferase